MCKKKAMTVLMYGEEHIFKKGGRLSYIFSIAKDYWFSINGIPCHSYWYVKNDDELCKVDTATISNYALLSPALGEYGYTNIDKLSLYYIIESEWKDLDRYIQFNLPKSPGCSYRIVDYVGISLSLYNIIML